MNIPEVKPNAGEILKDIRLSKGMTQVTLAERMGLNNSQHIWNIEHGTNRLTLDMVNPAAKALSVTPDTFLREKVKQNI